MRETIVVEVDERGHLFVPEAVSEKLNLTPGMTLVVEEGLAGEVELRPQTENSILVDKGGVWVARAEAQEDLTDCVDKHRSERMLRTQM